MVHQPSNHSPSRWSPWTIVSTLPAKMHLALVRSILAPFIDQGATKPADLMAPTPLAPKTYRDYLDTRATPTFDRLNLAPETARPTAQTTETTAGPTSAANAVIHICELVERHHITILAIDLPSSAAARTDVARLHAEAWARAHDLDIVGAIHIISGSTLQQGSAFNGVEFEVHVGHGDVALNQDPPGVLDRWTWSARSTYWRRHLAGVARGGRVLARREDGHADVVHLHRYDDTAAEIKEFYGNGADMLKAFGLDNEERTDEHQ